VNFIQTKAAHAFVDEVRDRGPQSDPEDRGGEGGKRTANEGCEKYLQPPRERGRHRPSATGMDDRYAGSVRMPVTSVDTACRELTRRPIKIRETSNSRCERGTRASSPSISRFTLNVIAKRTDDSLIAEGWT
jgi:hypothetical protein